MGSIDWNRRIWDDPSNWAGFGDGWTFHAQACGQPYERWKCSVVETFVEPFLGPDIDMLEIAPGHGRWTEHMVGRVRTLTLVDLSPSCIETCRERFSRGHPEITFSVNDGRSLEVPDQSIDVVWSFSSFVHMDEPEITAYLNEIRRVLRPGGRFLIHHAGWVGWTVPIAPAAGSLGRPGRVLVRRMAQGSWRGAGDRGAMSAKRFERLARDQALSVDRQLRRWGSRGEFSVAFRDVVTIGSSAGVPQTTPGSERTGDPEEIEKRADFTELNALTSPTTGFFTGASLAMPGTGSGSGRSATLL